MDNVVRICKVTTKDLSNITEIVQIHLDTFEGFFLTFMGRGFLKQMYSSYCLHDKSGLYVAYLDNEIVGFLSYSFDMSDLYKYMIKRKFFPFAWYAVGAFLRKPKAFFRIIRAFLKPSESKRSEQYVELSSIGVKPSIKSNGIGSLLLSKLIEETDFDKFSYISLETDAVNNEGANAFYKKNGFVLFKSYETQEHRLMNEYRFSKRKRRVETI